MGAAKVMILYDHSTRGRLNAEGIGETVPADNQNVAHHRPGACGVRFGTATSSPGSVHLLCWASSCHSWTRLCGTVSPHPRSPGMCRENSSEAASDSKCTPERTQTLCRSRAARSG